MAALAGGSRGVPVIIDHRQQKPNDEALSLRRDSRVPVDTKMEKMFQNHYTGSSVEPRGPGVACIPPRM